MVSLDLLSSLDGLLWLQAGKQVGETFQQHQTTVSRNQKKCARTFGLTLRKQRGTWALEGSTELLNLEREVHQAARFAGQAPLRLEGNGWMDGLLCTPPPPGWLLGACKPGGQSRCLELLHERIVDAWLCPLPDIPSQHPSLSIQPLCSLPVRLMVAPEHPLLHQKDLSLERIRRYPWQQIKPGAYPGTEQLLKAHGVCPPARRGQNREAPQDDGPHGVSFRVHIGSVLTSQPEQPALVPLPLNLNAVTGVALIVLQDHSDRSAIRHLEARLRQTLQEARNLYPDIQMLA